MGKWKNIRPYAGSAQNLSYSGPGYVAITRTDRWTKKWLKEDKIHQPENFFDLRDIDVAFVRRGAGIVYDVNGERRMGVVMQRRGQKLRMRCGNEIHIIMLFAARKDWGIYYRGTAGRYLKMLDKKLLTMRLKVKAAAQFLDRLKDSQCLPYTETSFYIRFCDLIKWQKLTGQESAFIHKYYETLKRAKNTIFKN